MGSTQEILEENRLQRHCHIERFTTSLKGYAFVMNLGGYGNGSICCGSGDDAFVIWGTPFGLEGAWAFFGVSWEIPNWYFEQANSVNSSWFCATAIILQFVRCSKGSNTKETATAQRTASN